MSSAERPDIAAGEESGTIAGDLARLGRMKIAEKDEAPLSLVALRDVAILSILLSLFGAADTWARSTGLWLAGTVSMVDGLLVGAASVALLHEWGHFIGARLGGGHAPIKPLKAFPQLFDFDYKNNDARSFRWMSLGGNLGNWGGVLWLVLALPLDSVGTDALVAGAVGFSVFTAFVEFPVIRKARQGASGLEALGVIPKDFATRYLPQSLGAALLTFLIV